MIHELINFSEHFQVNPVCLLLRPPLICSAFQVMFCEIIDSCGCKKIYHDRSAELKIQLNTRSD